MFYLVGSRFYGMHREDSDYDYVAEDTPENRATCERMGLQRILSSPKVRYGGLSNGRSYDVCLYKNVAKYVRARDKVAQLPSIYGWTTDERHAKVLEFLQEDTDGMV